ncbi:hypothetical protein AURDEDRAFT_173688, partial [Auricularia subglabra TFB-10046 SS5]
YNTDGSVNGFIKEYVELLIKIRDADGREHVEKRDFPVANLGGKQDLFLRYDWLVDHNPEIDWQKASITFSRCPPRCGIPRPTPATPARIVPAEMPYLRDTADTFADHLDVVADDDEDYIRAFQSISTRIEHEAQTITSVEIPPQYREFANIFEKKEFDRLPPHRR